MTGYAQAPTRRPEGQYLTSGLCTRADGFASVSDDLVRDVQIWAFSRRGCGRDVRLRGIGAMLHYVLSSLRYTVVSQFPGGVI